MKETKVRKLNAKSTAAFAKAIIGHCEDLDHAFIQFIGEETEEMTKWMLLRDELIKNIAQTLIEEVEVLTK